MKAFIVSEKGVEAGLPVVTFYPYPHVAVGESGPGRRLEMVSVAQHFGEVAQFDRIEHVSVIKLEGRDALVPMDELNPADHRALFLVTVSAGSAGKIRWSGACSGEFPCRRRGEYFPRVQF